MQKSIGILHPATGPDPDCAVKQGESFHNRSGDGSLGIEVHSIEWTKRCV